MHNCLNLNVHGDILLIVLIIFISTSSLIGACNHFIQSLIMQMIILYISRCVIIIEKINSNVYVCMRDIGHHFFVSSLHRVLSHSMIINIIYYLNIEN